MTGSSVRWLVTGATQQAAAAAAPNLLRLSQFSVRAAAGACLSWRQDLARAAAAADAKEATDLAGSLSLNDAEVSNVRYSSPGPSVG